MLVRTLTRAIKNIGVLLKQARGGNADHRLIADPEGHNGAQVIMLLLEELVQAARTLDVNQIAISKHTHTGHQHTCNGTLVLKTVSVLSCNPQFEAITE